MLRREGAFWQREYYDHLIRNEDEFHRIVQYVAGNPVKAGLSNWPWVDVSGAYDAEGAVDAAVSAALPVPPARTLASSQTNESDGGVAETAALRGTFGPEDVFNYMYAVFHSPTYRSRYAEFLKIDFPRLPLTSDPALFKTLCGLGGELVALHLMEADASPIASYPARGDNRVEKVQYTPPHGSEPGRVYINKSQYFEGVPPQVWDFHIGGYRVAEKWLKDRKGRTLTFDDLSHYARVVAALQETMRLMEAIDAAIPGWPIT